MGLPIWRAPSPVQSKTEVKNDPTSASRSSIRRTHRRTPELRRATALRRIVAEHADRGNNIAEQYGNGTIDMSEDLPRERAALRRRQVGSDVAEQPLPPVPESRNYRRTESPETFTFPSSGMFRSPERIGDSLTRSRRRWEEIDSMRPTPPRDHTPPFDIRHQAQARAQRVAQLMDLSQARNHRTSTQSNNTVHESSDGPRSERPSMRRSWRPADMFAQSRPQIDGLGDRERSVDNSVPRDRPDSPVYSEWDRLDMVDEIVPDQQLPSADSSFTTAAVSASFSNSHPSTRSGSANSAASSSRTHLTVPETTACDSSSDSDDSDVERTRAPTYPMRYRARGRQDRSSLAEISALISDQQTLMAEQQARMQARAEAMGRPNPFLPRVVEPMTVEREMRRRSRVPQRPDDSTHHYSWEFDHDQPSSRLQEAELENIRPILERIARRGDVPEEYWLSVGLTPVVAQNIERERNAAAGRVRNSTVRETEF